MSHVLKRIAQRSAHFLTVCIARASTDRASRTLSSCARFAQSAARWRRTVRGYSVLGEKHRLSFCRKKESCFSVVVRAIALPVLLFFPISLLLSRTSRVCVCARAPKLSLLLACCDIIMITNDAITIEPGEAFRRRRAQQ